MTKTLLKNTFREIANSKARFISILAIIALGVGFFAGIKATVPSMYNMADEYYSQSDLMDYRLVSTVGFDKDDVKAVENLDNVTDVMPSYFADLVLKSNGNGGNGKVIRVIAAPKSYNNNKTLNTLNIKEGRLPEKKGEILVEYGSVGSSDYKIGDKVVFGSESGESNALDMVDTLEYTVVGKAESPMYISYQRGSTTIGNGNIAAFMYIYQDDFVTERYTEMYVKTSYSDGEGSVFDDEYSDNIESFTAALENTADLRCEVFNTDVIGKAKQELKDSKNDYNSEKSDAVAKLDEAKNKLDNSEKEYNDKISDAQNQLDDAKKQIDDGKTQLENSRSEYENGIAVGESELADAQTQLDNAKAEYNSGLENFNAKISQAEEELSAKESEFNLAKAEFEENQKPQLESAIQTCNAQIEALQAQIAVTEDDETLAALNAQLSQVQTLLTDCQTKLAQAQAQIDYAQEQINSGKQELETQKAEGQAQLDYALAQIQSAEAQLENGRTELENKKAEGQTQLSQAETDLNTAEEKYNSGKSELEEQKTNGRQQLDDGWKEYNDSKAEADEKFADAEQEIADAEDKINNLAEPEWYVFDRTDNPGYSTFAQNVERLGAVATVFPMFFLLVAVLVCVTTMSRLVEEKRKEIGILKALGYSNLSIIMKFAVYAVFAGVIGCTVGVLIGINTLPYIIYNAYQTMYYMPDISIVPDAQSIILGTLAAVLCTLLVSVIVCVRELSQSCAKILRPKTPKAGKRILLERITPIWKHMNFSAKLTTRNIFRYKSRMFMTIIGIAGCTALIVAAFGLKNSFIPLTDTQFGEIFKYNAVVIPKEGGTAEQLDYLKNAINNTGDAASIMLAGQQEVVVKKNNVVKDESTYLTVMEDSQRFSEVTELRTRGDNKHLDITDDSVMINEKMATELSVKVGDTVSVTVDDKTAELTVGGIYEQYIKNYVFISPKLYSEKFGEEPQFNMAQVVLKNPDEQTAFGEKMLTNDKVAGVTYLSSGIGEIEEMLNSLNMVVLVMIICAAALAFVVLYNLTNINIAERVCEIATFKVLGFYSRETSSVIYKENIVLTLGGILSGLVLGIFLTRFIIQTVEVDNIMFGRDILPTSFIFAALLTLAFALLVNFVMGFKIKKVNMVESLKSVE